jgi:hypothetical protein
MTMAGQKYGGFEDIVQESPRQAQVRQVPANVKTLLEQKRNTDMNQDQEIALDRNIREALKPLQGENYSSYVAATDAQLGNDGPLLLDKCLSSLPGTFALQLEKTSLSAMKQESPQWVRESIDLENAIHCLPNDRFGTCSIPKDEPSHHRHRFSLHSMGRESLLVASSEWRREHCRLHGAHAEERLSDRTTLPP